MISMVERGEVPVCAECQKYLSDALYVRIGSRRFHIDCYERELKKAKDVSRETQK